MRVVAFYGKCFQHSDALLRDQKLIELWKEVWTRTGFVPTIIGIDRAIEHPKFNEMNRFAIKMPTINHPMFEWFCWVRWCSIAIFTGELKSGCLFTDYDVFPTFRYGNVGLIDAITDDTIREGKQLANFDPNGGAGLMYGTKIGFDTLLERLMTYNPTGLEITNNRPHISDMIVLRNHCRKLWDEGAKDLQVTCPDAEDKEWPKAAFVHFGGWCRTMRHLSKADEIKVRLRI